MERRTVSVKGKTVAYYDEGSKNDPVVVFLHGFPESSKLWEETISYIRFLGFRAIAPDFPGFGLSEKFDEESTWERYVEFIDDFFAVIDIEQIHLVTHDWGVLIGTKWACLYPEKVVSLCILDGTFNPDFVWHKDALIIRTPVHGEQWVEQLRNKQVFSSFMNKSIPNVSSEVVDDFYRMFSNSETAKITLELYRSGDMEKLEKYRGRLSELLSMPITIIFGQNDIFIDPRYGIDLKERELPHASIHIIPKAGHFTPLEATEEMNSILHEHLAKAL